MNKTASCLLFLLSGTLCLAYEECPSPEEVTPCVCKEDRIAKEISFTCSKPETSLYQLKSSLNNVAGVKNLNIRLDGLNLAEFPSNFFYGLHVKVLEFFQCELDRLDDEHGQALLGLEETLQELSIISSFNEQQMPVKLSLGHMHRMIELYLSNNKITKLGDEWFKGGPLTLVHLTISNNGIRELGENAFANLISLKSFSLEGNQFSSIRRSMLPTYPDYLELLELDNNGFTSIPDDLFQGMTALRTVSLRANNLKRMDQTTWSSVWPQLNVLHLEGNPLQCDSHMDWLFSAGRTKFISGKCQSPRDKTGMDLKDLMRKNAPF